VVVPVPGAAVVLQITPRALVRAAPGVELVVVLGVEVLAVLLHRTPGVAVGRHDHVPVAGGQRGRGAHPAFACFVFMRSSILKTCMAFSRRNFGHTWSRNGTSGSSRKIRSSERPIGK